MYYFSYSFIDGVGNREARVYLKIQLDHNTEGSGNRATESIRALAFRLDLEGWIAADILAFPIEFISTLNRQITIWPPMTFIHST